MGLPDNEVRAIGLPKADLDVFGEKLIRGSSYLFSKLYIEEGHELSVQLTRSKEGPLSQLVDKYGRRIELAPGISIGRAGDAIEDPACGVFEFKFWERLFIYGWVIRSVDKK